MIAPEDYYVPSELNHFWYCPERWHLWKLLHRGAEIAHDPKLLKQHYERLSDGRNNHAEHLNVDIEQDGGMFHLLRHRLKIAPKRRMKLEVEYGMIYQDNQHQHMLYDQEYGLQGKPDRLYKVPGGLNVYEYKSGTVPDYLKAPYGGDKAQLAAYLRLCEMNYDERILGGTIEYHNKSFYLRWDEELRGFLLEVLQKMRGYEQGEDVNFPINGKKCAICPFHQHSCHLGGITPR